MNAHVEIQFIHDPVVNYALQQNDVPIIKQLRITNAGQFELRELHVRIDVEPDFATPWEGRLTSLAPGESHAFGQIRLTLSPKFLAELTERLAGTFRISVNAGAEQIHAESSRIDVLAYDEWGGLRSLPEAIAAFVTPNHPIVESVLADAASILSTWNKNASLNAYQSRSKRNALLQIAAIYEAIRKRGLKYISPPASFENDGQKIRLAERILESGLGTCLDLVLFFASCLEQGGLHPVIIFLKGHACLGVWLIDETFSDVVSDDSLRLKKRLELSEISLIETTLLTSPPPNNFLVASKLGAATLEKSEDFQCFIDIARSRKAAIRPLPLRSVHAAKSEDVSVRVSEPDPSIPDFSIPEEVTPPEQVREEPPSTPTSRLEHWKRKLLDLSLRNKLLNFRLTNKALRILCPDIASLEDALADDEKFEVLANPDEFTGDDPRSAEAFRRRTGNDALSAVLKEEFKAKRLRTDVGGAKLARQMLDIYREGTRQIEEGGASSLYLALGFLVWYETEASQKELRAPLILVPVEVLRRSVLEGFRLRKRDDEIRVNTTLLEMLAKDFQISMTGLDPIPLDEHGVDVPRILTKFREAVKGIDRWRVVEDACLGFFSFAKFLMWRDLEARTADLLQSPVVGHLVNTPDRPFHDGSGFPDADRLDQTHSPSETFCPVLADSSQLAAVYAAAEGKSFVLHGPPGTGKSQTITNIIAHCLACGKSVLFVSEKMAALSVVKERLARCGLGAFCLELHSSKSSKQEVVRQLGQSLARVAPYDSAHWAREAERLAVLRGELNDYVNVLHKIRRSGETAFQGLSNLIGLKDVRHIPLNWPSPETIDETMLERLETMAGHLGLAAKDIGTPAGHPWHGIACMEWSPVIQRSIQEALEAVPTVIISLKASTETLGGLLGIASTDPNLLDKYGAIASSLITSPRPPAALLQADDWPSTKEKVRGLVQNSRRRKELREILGAEFTPDVLKLDLESLLKTAIAAKDSWAVGRWIKNRTVAKSLRGVSAGGCAPDPDQFVDLLGVALELRELEAQWPEISLFGEEYLGAAWLGGYPTDEHINELFQRAEDLRTLSIRASAFSGHASADLLNIWASVIWSAHAELLNATAQFNLALETFRKSMERLDGFLGFTKSLSFAGASGQPLPFESLERKALALLEQINGFRLWCQWSKARFEAINLGLGPIVQALEEGKINPLETEIIFKRGYYQWWVERIVDAEPVLRNFFSTGFEDKIRKFKETDELYTNLTRDEIRARLSARVPLEGAKANDDSEMGVLSGQMRRQRNHMAIRALVQRIPNLLPRLKPCLLMSPMSIAQYLDAGHRLFDLVVFDEASQIPVWDAIGAIARGQQAIVVGDPKQLPPTNFFQCEDDDQDRISQDEIADQESILDECLAARLPQLHLRWHYRSRHESLIAFSNYHYYENSLLTFPSPHLDQSVSFRFVPGVYDKSKSRTNRIEADALVQEMLRRFASPHLSGRSIGVVTFSLAQSTLIEDLLEVERRNHPEIEPFFDPDNPERVFIKNLENVQGDERDVIFFSIGYGPDAAGKVSMNFGPLTRDGGERRLNVAVTRARKEVVLFSSMKPEQIDLARTRARGVQDLKYYMEYAQRGMAAIRETISLDPSADCESPFEQQVCDALREKGHLVHTQVGCSGYRIDMAIVDPGLPGRYLLGIECDGANYHRSRTARDRDRLREMVLRGLGWDIVRIWSTDWWQNPQTALAKIETAIEGARQNRQERPADSFLVPFPSSPARSQSPQPLVASGPAAPSPDEGIERYRPTFTPVAPWNREEYYLPQAMPRIQTAIREVMEREAPMSLTLLARRVGSRWTFTKATEKSKDRILLATRTMPDILTRKERDEIFIWFSKMPPAEYEGFRVPSNDPESQREAKDIPPEEITNAARHILKQHISASREVLIKETAYLLGFQSVGKKLRTYIQEGVDRLALHRDIKTEGGNMILN